MPFGLQGQGSSPTLLQPVVRPSVSQVSHSAAAALRATRCGWVGSAASNSSFHQLVHQGLGGSPLWVWRVWTTAAVLLARANGSRGHRPWQHSGPHWAASGSTLPGSTAPGSSLSCSGPVGPFLACCCLWPFWCRLASLAAGCVATIASPLYCSSAPFYEFRAAAAGRAVHNELSPRFYAAPEPPLPPLLRWRMPSAASRQPVLSLLRQEPSPPQAGQVPQVVVPGRP